MRKIKPKMVLTCNIPLNECTSVTYVEACSVVAFNKYFIIINRKHKKLAACLLLFIKIISFKTFCDDVVKTYVEHI